MSAVQLSMPTSATHERLSYSSRCLRGTAVATGGRRDGIFRYRLRAKKGLYISNKNEGAAPAQSTVVASNFPTSRRLRGCDFEFPGSRRRWPTAWVEGSRDGIFGCLPPHERRSYCSSCLRGTAVATGGGRDGWFLFTSDR